MAWILSSWPSVSSEDTGTQYFSLSTILIFSLCILRYEECVESCTKLLEQNPYDEQIWSLKTRALTEQVHVCDVEADEEGIVDVVLDDNTIRAVPRPGTSLRTASTQQTAQSQAFR